MDAISLLAGPGPAKQGLTQDEFDQRYNYLPPPLHQCPESSQAGQWIGDAFREKTKWDRTRIFDVFPSLQWISRYNPKAELPRDILGSLLIAALLIPQGLVSGHLAIDDPIRGLYSVFFPQLLYLLLGSSRHSSIGGASFVSLFVASSIQHSGSDLATITLLCAFFHCVRWAWSCVTSASPWTLLLGGSVLTLSALFHHVINPSALERLHFTIPHEMLLILASILLSYTCDLGAHGIKVLHKTSMVPPAIEAPRLATFFERSVLDSFSLALFLLASHLKTSREVAMEKMQKVDRKQEAAAFSLVELPLAFLNLPPVASSIGHSQLNVETARFSLLANALCCGWLLAFVVFCLPILHYLPTVVLSGVLLLCFSNVPVELVHLRQLYRVSKRDCVAYLLSAVTLLVIPNICFGFLCAMALNLFLVAHRSLWPHTWAIIRLDSDGRFAEESRYEGDPCDAPARVLRFNAPLLFGNVDKFHESVRREVKLIKGQVPLGIGTRTGSLRSQIGALGDVLPHKGVEVRLSAPLEARLSLVQSKTNLTNFVINDPQNQIIGGDQPLIRCLIIDFNTIPAVDSHGMHALNQVYFELHEQQVRLLLAAVNAKVRDSMHAAGIFSLLPKNSLYPTLNDALLASRAMVMPIHTSVSMNGCRDVIAVSACGSHFDVATICTNRDNDSKGEPAQI
ncbi:unnamed protein product, partial [Mesorhabditis spiculigera]